MNFNGVSIKLISSNYFSFIGFMKDTILLESILF